MEPITIRKQIVIAAPPATVWCYVGTADGLRAWWQSEVTLEPTVGGRFAETGTIDGQPYHRRGTVRIYEPPNRLSIILSEVSDTAEQQKRWLSHTELDIVLRGTEKQTTVTIVHRAHVIDQVATSFSSEEFDGVDSPVTQNWAGPTMALTGTAQTIAVLSPAHGLITLTEPTLETLYRWQHHQQAYWSHRCSQLQIVLSPSKEH